MTTKTDVKKALKPFTDKQLRDELTRRMRERSRKENKALKARLPEAVGIEGFMMARHGEIDMPAFKPFYDWFKATYEAKGRLHSSGNWSQTGQRAIQVMLYRDQPLDEQLAILDFLPYIEPLPMEHVRPEGGRYGEEISLTGKPVDIFEHTLSRNGSYQMLVTEERTYITLTRYYRTEVMASFPDFKDALAYVQKNHYYQTARGRYDTSDDE